MTSTDSEVDEPIDCGACGGTGIGQSGPPDASRCWMCGGSGIARVDDQDWDSEDTEDNEDET